MKYPIVAPLSAFLIAWSVSAVAADKNVSRIPPTLAAPRSVALEWTSAQGRPYWYRLPKSVDGKKNRPNLVLMLHGTGLDHRWSFWNYPIAKGKFRGSDIVVSPDGLTPGGKTFNFVQGKTDGDQIVDLIREFRRRFPIRNVYLYGHSQGAFFAYWFAGEHTEWVDGIVAHAGNVLQVKHSKLARKKLAICVLHGDADAVVPVSCAHRTAKIYRDEKYEKVKLEIVEGLTAKSGHWPLPTQVSEMFEWLDSQSVLDARMALENALGELRSESPSLLVVSQSITRAELALQAPAARRIKKATRTRLEEVIERLTKFVDRAASTHAKAILGGYAKDKKGTTATWAAHFRAVHPALQGNKSWSKEAKKVLKTAASQSKKVAKALQLLRARPNGKVFRSAIGVFEDSPLSPESAALGLQLHELAEKNSAGGKSAETLDEVFSGREKAQAKARERSEEITASIAGKFRKAFPKLFRSKG